MNISMFSRVLVRMFVLAGLCLGAFGPTGAQPATAAGPILTIAVSEEAPGLDPATDQSLSTWVISGQVFDTLTRLPAGAKIPQASLAESWSTPDGVTWTFNLRPGVTFHDGTSLDANAVKFNLERWWDPANPYHTGDFGYFGYIFGFKDDPNQPSLIANITTIGSNQIIITLSQQNRLLPWFLSMQPFAIASPAAVMAGTLSQHPVGTGPFRFVEWVQGDYILLDANTGYWLKTPYLGGLKVRAISDSNARLEAIRSNAAQVAFEMPGSDYTSAGLDINMAVFAQPTPNIGYLGINRAKGPLQNPLVREAIAHAINKARLIRADYDPVDRAAGQFLPPEVLGSDPAIADYIYDPALAKTLLAQAGYANGFSITLTYRNVYRLYLRKPAAAAQAIAADLAAVGINAAVSEMESAPFLDSVYSGNADLFLLGWVADYPHPSNMFSVVCGGSGLAFGPVDTVLCNAVDSAGNMTDPAEQEAAYQSASKRMRDTLPLIPLSHGMNTVIGRSEIAGLAPTIGNDGADFENVYFVSGPNGTAQPGEAAQIEVSGIQAPSTIIEIPAGSVEQPVTVAYVQETGAPLPPEGQTTVGEAFNLAAFQEAAPMDSLTFNQPVSITIDYSAFGRFIDPATLELYVAIPPAARSVQSAAVDPWQPANTTCMDPTKSVIDPGKRTLTAYVCETGTYSLFGLQNKVGVFLPNVSK